MKGPPNSPYEGGIFHLEILLPKEYPMAPPKCLFSTKIFHPNIDKLGRICLDILKKKWTPALQIGKVLLSIRSLLETPDYEDFLDPKVAKVWKEDPDKAVAMAKEWTQLYAMKK